MAEKIEEDGKFSFVLFSEEGFFSAAICSESNGAVLLKNEEASVMSALKSAFENENIEKTGLDIKKDLKILKRNGIEIKGKVLDLALACYVLNPTRDTYNFDDISVEFLNENIKSEEEVLGKGKSRKGGDNLFSGARNMADGRHHRGKKKRDS